MNKTGLAGERITIKYLRKYRYKIIQRNFKSKYGEIDIIAKDGEYLCFVEVKARTSTSFAEPYESVDYKKQRKIHRLAKIWLSIHKLDNSLCRFDIVSLLLYKNYKLRKIEIIKNAFWAND